MSTYYCIHEHIGGPKDVFDCGFITNAITPEEAVVEYMNVLEETEERNYKYPHEGFVYCSAFGSEPKKFAYRLQYVPRYFAKMVEE